MIIRTADYPCPDTPTATPPGSSPNSWPSNRAGCPSWWSTARAPQSATSCTSPTWPAHSSSPYTPASPGHWRAYNVGSGHPSTVHDVIATTETVTGRLVPRRHTTAAHEPSTLVADSTRIRSELGSQPEKSSLPEIISDAWTALTSE